MKIEKELIINDIDQAIYWYQKSAKSGNKYSWIKLGELIIKNDEICKVCYTRKKNNWCKNCMKELLRLDFAKCTSGNKIIDDFIKNNQVNITSKLNIIEWVEYDKFKNINYLADGGFFYSLFRNLD